MIETFHYATLPAEDQVPTPKASAVFRRCVHLHSNAARLPMLSRSDERELIGNAQDSDSAEAMQRLVMHYMPFIQSIAQRFAANNGQEIMLDDLMSEGVEGFMQSVRRYDLKRQSARLSSFSRYHVSGKILTYILNNKHAFCVGTSSGERVFLLGYAGHLARFEEAQGRAFCPANPTDLDIMSTQTGASTAAIRRVCQLRAAGRDVSFTQVDIVDSRETTLPDARLARREFAYILSEEVARVTGAMPERNRSIVLSLMTESGDTSETRGRLAKAHGVTLERIGQIYREAIGDIRRALAKRGITGSLDQ